MTHASGLDDDRIAGRTRPPGLPDAPVTVLAGEMLSTYGRLSARRGVLARVFRRRRRRAARRRDG